MPIQVHCSHCNAGFQAKDEHAGKRAKCPKCGQVLVIAAGNGPAAGVKKATRAAAAQPKPAAPAAAPVRICPSCGTTMAEKAILCINCGYNVSTGQKVSGAVAAGASNAPQAVEPTCCTACGAPMPPGTRVCLRCGVDNRAVESELQSRRTTRRSGPTRLHYIALSVFVVLFAVVGVQCTRMFFYDYGAQFAALINEHKALAKFDSELRLKTEKEQGEVPYFPGKVLVCWENGQIGREFTDPDTKIFLPRKPSEVRTILFVRQTDVKVTIASGMVPVVLDGPVGIPTATGIRVVCQICIVDCASKSVVGDDVFYVDPIGAADSMDVTASAGKGPVGLKLTDWVQRHVANAGM